MIFLSCSSLLLIVFVNGNNDEWVVWLSPPDIIEDNEAFGSIGDLWLDDKEEALFFSVIERPFPASDFDSEDFETP